MAVGDRMFMRMQDFDFFPNLIKFYPIIQIYPNWSKFFQICLKNLLGDDCGHIHGSYATESWASDSPLP